MNSTCKGVCCLGSSIYVYFDSSNKFSSFLNKPEVKFYLRLKPSSFFLLFYVQNLIFVCAVLAGQTLEQHLGQLGPEPYFAASMKPEKKLVKDLDDKVGPHTIRLMVIDKGNTQYSPNKRSSHYQRIVFQDEEGSKIKTILYNDDIGAYENIIQSKVEYDISNAKIRPMPEKYRLTADDHPFQLSFGSDTIIKAVEGSKPPIGPEYVTIAAIPRTNTTDDRYDVVGVLIYVEPLRQVPRPSGLPLDVREWIIIDHSTEHPLIITAWAELATREGQQLQEVAESFPIIGVTSLKPSYHKGFSLSTTSSTFVKINPEGEKADMLRAWAAANKTTISAKHCQVLDIRAPATTRVTTTTRKIRTKKAADTLQEERHWLHVSSPEFDRKDVRFYLGCIHCGTGSKKEINVEYTCTTCKRAAVTSLPRMNITFEAIDETGSYMFTAFTNDAEKLLQKKASEFYTMDLEVRDKCLTDAESRIRNSKFYIQVGPAPALSRNGVLKWVLKQLSLE
ncbi:replication protein A 70 kDa DNA-binding subunit B-like isoform X2 [Silene latifolia]|uniref:replication protein A 70 kDa DNA-binding subunit B-like isoform X2 n=1 Tax=Silene latifolia TaxID=37657 RepID=UPI003D7714B6